jgi:hypothetical protein
VAESTAFAAMTIAEGQSEDSSNEAAKVVMAGDFAARRLGDLHHDQIRSRVRQD